MLRTLFSSTVLPLFKNTLAYSTATTCPKVAVVLSGCGVFDGSEIHEASAILCHLTRLKALPQCFAPLINQAHVVNHLEGKEDNTHSRCVLTESARIARGNILPLSKLPDLVNCFDAVIFPGGFGAAKNLSDFAMKGVECTVHPDVTCVIKEFHCRRKPIALACIAPILAAKTIKDVTITLGKNDPVKWPYRDAIRQAKMMGATVEDRDWNEVSYDKANMVFSTPAYMYEGQFHEIYEGIGNMITYMINIMQREKQKNDP